MIFLIFPIRQQSVMSGASFLTEGNAFYYHFNFSLCGKAENNLASCIDNSTAIGQVLKHFYSLNIPMVFFLFVGSLGRK